MAFQDHNKGPEVLAVFGTGTALASIAVILRLWVRARILRKIGADDWIMAISLVLVYASLGCIAVSVHHGLGRHTEFLAPKETSTALKFLWVGFCFTPSAEATAKISISIMLMRITTNAKWKLFFISLITLMMMITVASLLVILLSCWHVELLRDPTRNDHCETLPRTVIIYIQGVMAAGYDIILASSPIFLLWKVKINFYDKTLLCGLLGLGFFTSATGIVRTVYTPGATRGEDATYTILDFLIWKSVELPLSIIVGCLPTLRPLFNRSKLDRSYQKQEDSYGLTNRGIDQRIRKTTTIDLDVDAVSSDNSHSVENSAWDVEARG